MRKGPALLLIIALAVVTICYFFYGQKRQQETQNYLGTIASEATEIVRVTTIEGERTVPIRYQHKGKAAFGIGLYRVRIGFDIEQMNHSIHKDTLFLQLPEPKLQILEHENYGFRILDVWGEDFLTRLTGASLTLEEENAMKQNALTTLRNEIIAEGHLERAKGQATELLLNIFSVVPGTVVVMDSRGQRIRPIEGKAYSSKISPIDTHQSKTKQ